MSRPISVRFPDELAERVRHHVVTTDEATSGLVVRLVDEGIRMAEHPGVVFRDGATGRRAGLASGPDIWEIITVVADYASGGVTRATARAAKHLALAEPQVRAAESYYASFPDEIDARIELNLAAAIDARRANATRSRLYG